MLIEEADFEPVERLINVKWDIMQQVRVEIVYQALLEKITHLRINSFSMGKTNFRKFPLKI